MEMINIAGRNIACGQYDDALDALQTAYPDEWDAFHYIRRNMDEIAAETESQLEILQNDYAELEKENSANWEMDRNIAIDARDMAEDALEILDARRLDKQKLRKVLENIATLFENNY